MPISITPPPTESATRTSTNPLITLPEGTNTALIPLPTEAIAQTVQQGHDLIIILTDGHRITLADFFVLPAPALILREPTTGDHTEILLGEKGTLIGQQPRSLAELFTATQTTGSGTGWTAATGLGVLAGSAAVLTALTTAARKTNGERPEGAANQTETETDSSDGSEGSGAGTGTDTTETDTDTQGGETGTEEDQEETDAGMSTDQGTDMDEKDTDAHMTTNPSTDTSDGDEGMEGDQTPDKDQQTDGAVAPAQVTDGDEEDGTETDGGEESPDENDDDSDASVDQGMEAEGANMLIGRKVPLARTAPTRSPMLVQPLTARCRCHSQTARAL